MEPNTSHQNHLYLVNKVNVIGVKAYADMYLPEGSVK